MINIQSSNVENILHSQSSMGPTVSMEMPQAEVYLKASHIMGWIKSLNSFEKSTLRHSFYMLKVLNKRESVFREPLHVTDIHLKHVALAWMGRAGAVVQHEWAIDTHSSIISHMCPPFIINALFASVHLVSDFKCPFNISVYLVVKGNNDGYVLRYLKVLGSKMPTNISWRSDNSL